MAITKSESKFERGSNETFASARQFVTPATLALAILLVLAFASPSAAQREDSNRGYDYEGPYAQFGVSVGQIDFDNTGNIDNNASGGFNLTGGYRFLPWLSGELNFTYLGGGAVEAGSIDIGDGSFWAFTFGPKFYPLGAFKVEQIPESIQPYALTQIGGGQFEIDNTNFEEGAFVVRFLLGTDFWFTDHLGAFVEGGGHVSSENDVDGVGIFTVGGQYRF